MAARLWCYEMASLEVGETGAGNSEGAFNCAGPIKRTPCARLTAVMIYTAPKMGHQRCPAVSRKWPRFGQRFMLEHFSAACPVSLLRVRYSGSLRGLLHRCTMATCSARIDPRSLRGRLHRCTTETCSARIELHTIFALAPWAISLKNALKHGCVLHSLSLQSGRRRCSRHSIDDLAFAARRICAANGSRSSQPP